MGLILPPVYLTIEDERILRKQSDATATGVMSMLNIVLVEPEIPQNCGNIARTCAATGGRLHLIRPLGFDISEKAVRRAGLDYWHMVEVRDYENLEDLFRRHPEAVRLVEVPARELTDVDTPAQLSALEQAGQSD